MKGLTQTIEKDTPARQAVTPEPVNTVPTRRLNIELLEERVAPDHLLPIPGRTAGWGC